MTPKEKQALISALAGHSTAKLESFFRSHDLADAFRRPDSGWGKEKRVNEALAAAEKRGDADAVLLDAARHFAFANEGHVRPPRPSTTGKRDVDQDMLGIARIGRLHPAIREASADLFRDGHPAAAVLEAFKAIEIQVRNALGAGRSARRGKDLMAHAFGGETPSLAINPGITESDRNEQEGFKFIFMGVMQGIRNPKAHDQFAPLDEDRAFEYLALASLLMRRLDDTAAVHEGRGAES